LNFLFKAKFEQVTRLSPIRSKFVNVSLQIRATTNSLYQNSQKSTSLTTTLISSTNLYTFNCSYFRECSQCLSQQLGDSCVWCAKNSKCIFAKPAFSSSNGAKNNKLEFGDECPNEIEYYQRANLMNRVNVMCTSFQWSSKKSTTNLDNRRVEIAYSAESSLAQSSLNRLAIKNPHRNYQLSFKCVFSKQKRIDPSEMLHDSMVASYVEWLPEENQSPNLFPFDCKYAPYNDAKQLSADLALQTMYLSVWWSSQPQMSGQHLNSLDGWNQVKIKSDLDDLQEGEFIFSKFRY
jgi:hypothetical protein